MGQIFCENPIGQESVTTAFRGCMMCHSLYVKANGEMPCWDDVGEKLSIRLLNEAALLNGQEPPVFHGPELVNIRQSFLDGRDPFPEVCSQCAMRGHATEPVLKPRTMEVLQLESSYLCHLSCPQCIPAANRRALRPPPHNMTPGLLEGLLQQLKAESIEHIGFILFEGRGDPLRNLQLETLIASARSFYPNSLISLTSHCSYPYKPWIVRSELNVLRAAIDGATAQSYLKYRVGGSFELALEFLRRLRDDRIRMHSSLRVEWKYILFEWNDSPEEMRLAADFAKELQVRLIFVRTHSPGHSKRFITDQELQKYIRQFLPGSVIENTFPLKSEHKSDVMPSVTAEHVAALVAHAVERLGIGDEADARRQLAEALRFDPGIPVSRSESSPIDEILRGRLSEILAGARFPSTLSSLAALSRELGDLPASDALLARYLELALDAPDREHILADRLIRTAIAHAENCRFDLAYRDLRQAISLELSISAKSKELEYPVRFCAKRAADSNLPLSIEEAAARIAYMKRNYWRPKRLLKHFIVYFKRIQLQFQAKMRFLVV